MSLPDYHPATLCELILGRALRSHPDSLALLTPDVDPLSFAALYAEIQKPWVERWIEPREAVALVLPAIPALLTSLLAVTGRAAASVVDPALTAAEYEQMLLRLDPRTVLVASASAPAAQVARAQGRQVILCGQGDPELLAPAQVPGRRIDAALLQFTSASTGAPKIVIRTAAQVIAGIDADIQSIDLGAQDRYLSMLPLHYLHGLACLLGQWRSGGQVVLLPSGFDGAALERAFRVFRPTWTSGGIPLFEAMLRVPDPPPLRVIRSTGPAPAPEFVARLEAKYQAPYLSGYGTTEAQGIGRSTVARRRSGSVGVLLGVEAKILDGEVVVCGPAVMQGYLDDPEATAQVMRDGWLHTGDIGHFDADGFLFLTGRLKSFIFQGGRKILPEEVEAALTALPQVADAICFPLPHPRWGESVAAAVVLKPGVAVGAPEIRRALARTLATYKLPTRIELVESIPRSETGKVQRAAYARRFAATASPAVEFTWSDRERRIRNIWARILEREDIGPEQDFFALGGDSLLATSMLQAVESELGGPGLLGAGAFFEEPTIRALATLTEAESSGRQGGLLLRRGGASDVILIPGVAEDGPLCLRHVAQAMPQEWTCYGLVPPLLGSEVSTVEESAARLLASLRQLQPHGPYRLVGHCHGGVLGFELARQLEQAGERVDVLVLMDTEAPGYPRPGSNWKKYLRALRHPPSPVEVVKHLRALRAYRAEASPLPGAPAEHLEKRRASRTAVLHYRIQSIHAPVVQLLAGDRQVEARVLEDPRLSWKHHCSGGFRATAVPGQHDSMLALEHAGSTAGALHAALTSRPAQRSQT